MLIMILFRWLVVVVVVVVVVVDFSQVESKIERTTQLTIFNLLQSSAIFCNQQSEVNAKVTKHDYTQ